MSCESSKKRRARRSARARFETITLTSIITTLSEMAVNSQRVTGE